MSSTYSGRSANGHNGRLPEIGETEEIQVALLSADQALIRHLAMALDADRRFVLNATAFDGMGIESWLLGHPVDLAIVDVEPPTNVSLQAIRLISNRYPATQVMALMSRRSLDTATVAVQVGAQSCLLKETSGPADVIAALNGLVAGSNAISPRIARVLINRFRQLH